MSPNLLCPVIDAEGSRKSKVLGKTWDGYAPGHGSLFLPFPVALHIPNFQD